MIVDRNAADHVLRRCTAGAPSNNLISLRCGSRIPCAINPPSPPGIEGLGGWGVMMYMYSGRWCPMHSSDVLPFVGVIVEWLQYNTMYV